MSAAVMTFGSVKRLTGTPTKAVPHPTVDEEMAFAQRLLKRMPPRRRKIFLMHVMDRLTYTQIAARLEIRLETVKKELLKAFETCAKVK